MSGMLASVRTSSLLHSDGRSCQPPPLQCSISRFDPYNWSIYTLAGSVATSDWAEEKA